MKAIIGMIISAALNWATEKLAALIAKIMRRKEIIKDAEGSVDPLKKAKTKEEVDEAAKSALDGF
jgi:hypothetical protein